MKKTLNILFLLFINWAFADVLVSIKPLALVVNEITGEKTDYLIKNSDIHTYSLTISDLKKINEVDLFYFVGDSAETFLKKGVKYRKNPSIELMKLNGMLILSNSEHHHKDHEHHHKDHEHHHKDHEHHHKDHEHHHKDHEHHHKDHEHHHKDHEHHHKDHEHEHSIDSHIWLETKNMKVFAKKLVEDLIYLYPEKSDFYQKNLEVFVNKIDDLDKEIDNIYSKIPQKLNFFVNHDSYQYLDSKYNLKPSYVFNVYHGSGLSVQKLNLLSEKLDSKSCILIDYNANIEMLGKLIDLQNKDNNGVFEGLKGKMVIRDQLAINDEDYFTFMKNIANNLNLCL